MNPEIAKLITTIFEVLAPVVIQAIANAEHGKDPLDGLLHDSVLATLPAPLKSRLALDAANVADAAAP